MSDVGPGVGVGLVEANGLYRAGEIGSELYANFHRIGIPAVNETRGRSRLPYGATWTRLTGKINSCNIGTGEAYSLCVWRKYISGFCWRYKIRTCDEAGKAVVTRRISSGGKRRRTCQTDDGTQTSASRNRARDTKRIGDHRNEIQVVHRQTIDSDDLASGSECHARAAGSDAVGPIDKAGELVITGGISYRYGVCSSTES